MNIIASWTHTLQPSPVQGSACATGMHDTKSRGAEGQHTLVFNLLHYTMDTAMEEVLHGLALHCF